MWISDICLSKQSYGHKFVPLQVCLFVSLQEYVFVLHAPLLFYGGMLSEEFKGFKFGLWLSVINVLCSGDLRTIEKFKY